jgi:hypothetical protein
MKNATQPKRVRMAWISVMVAILQISAGIAGVIASTAIKNISNEVNTTTAEVGALLNHGLEAITINEVSIPGDISKVDGANRGLEMLPGPMVVLMVYCVVTLLGILLLIGSIHLIVDRPGGSIMTWGWAVLALLWTFIPFTGHYESLAVLRFISIELHIAVGIVCLLGAAFVQIFWPIWLLCHLRPFKGS